MRLKNEMCMKHTRSEHLSIHYTSGMTFLQTRAARLAFNGFYYKQKQGKPL